MEVDIEVKAAAAVVNATKVAEEKEPEMATEMIVESSSVIDQVTELAEKWQELALKPFEVDMRIAQWIIHVTKVKTELRFMMSMFKAAESIRRGEKDPLQWIVEQVTESKMEGGVERNNDSEKPRTH